MARRFIYCVPLMEDGTRRFISCVPLMGDRWLVIYLLCALMEDRNGLGFIYLVCPPMGR